jgi:hypothetical protein
MKKKFPITAECSKCGHSGQLFMDDESAMKQMLEFIRTSTVSLWRPLLVRRMFVSWLVLFIIGFLAGRLR